jgi:hypothetical protein
LVPTTLPYSEHQQATSGLGAVRAAIAILIALFILFAGNFITAVVMNSYLRALGDDGDACKVLRAHESLLSVLRRAVYTQWRYFRWWYNTRRERRLSQKMKRKEKLRRRKIEKGEYVEPDLEDDPYNPLRLWRQLPYADRVQAAATDMKLRWTVWARLCASPDAKVILETFLCPYTQELIYPSAGGDPSAFSPLSFTGVLNRCIDMGVDDPESLAAVITVLYATEVMPTGIRRSKDGYFPGQGVGREDDGGPWEPTPHIGTSSHMERALGLSESRLGSEMRKLTHAQEMLHEMMSQMQRQAEGMDKAQQVILQYLVSQQAKRDSEAKLAAITKAQQGQFFPRGAPA